jgi:ribosomal protein L20
MCRTDLIFERGVLVRVSWKSIRLHRRRIRHDIRSLWKCRINSGIWEARLPYQFG